MKGFGALKYFFGNELVSKWVISLAPPREKGNSR